MRITSFRGKTQPVVVTTSDVFIFTAILLFGPEVAVTVAAIDTGLTAIHRFIYMSKRPYKIIFNLTQLSLVTFVVGHIFYQLQGVSPPLDVSTVDMTGFFLGTGFVLDAVFRSEHRSSGYSDWFNSPVVRIFPVAWKSDFLWVSLTTFAGASAAALIFLFFKETPFFAIAVAAPIVLIIYYAYKINLDRINAVSEARQPAQRTLSIDR